MGNKIKEVVMQTIPLLLGLFFAGLLWKYNIILLLVFIGILIAVFLIKYNKGEFIILLYGIGIGLLIEILGTYVIHYQSFANPDILGIPLWLPVAWGYAFVLMGRIAKILSK